MRADEARRRRPVTGWLAVLLVAGLAAWPLLSVYPYYLAYFNPLLGGGAAAQRVVFVGWGEGLDRVAAYLNTKPIVLQEPAVATAYHRALQAHLRGNNAMPLERAELADYIVPYVNSIQRNQDAEVLAPYLEGQEPEHVVWINNIEYARIYRGPHLAVERQVDVDFGGRARLDGVVLAPGSGRVRAGDEVLLRLRWEASGGVEGLTSVVRLVSLGGQAAVQDRQALARAMREGGLLVLDTRLAVPRGLSAGGYALEASIEDGRGEAVAVAGDGWAWAIQQVTVLPAVAR